MLDKISCQTLLASLLIAISFSLHSAAISAQSSPEQSIKSSWDLSELYPDIAAWESARKSVAKQIAELTQCRGQLNTDAQTLGQCLQSNSEAYKNLMRLYTYSFLAKDTDLANSAFRERHTQAEDLLTTYSENVSYLEPELLSIDKDKLLQWQQNTPALSDYDFLIRNTLRKAPHVLPAREEKILAASSAPLRMASSAYSILTNAEIPRPEITLSTGELVKLTPSGYTQFRGTENRTDRKAVFDAFFGSYINYQQTLAQTLSGQVQAQIFDARMRGYPSALARSLAVDNIPEAVYRTLVGTVNDNLPTLHRYLKLHARLLKIDDPHYYDVYPAIADLDKQYGIDDAHQLLDKALTPLGEDYRKLYQDSVGKGWMHVEPTEGKRSGAYAMSAAYDVHPYLLLNHNNDFDSVSTFAHEWGHGMHSLLTQHNQPFAKSEYATFIAEIASISHELLLYKYLAETASTKQEKLYYLFEELQGLRGTFFRQTQFAEFELAIHEEVENGSALSADKLNAIYGATLKRYYGHEQEVMKIDDTYTVEWAYIPHFYRNFYVYQYATSISAAYYLMDKVLSGGPKERQQYLSILEAGGSDYPYDILKTAGADMASPEIYEAVIKRCNQLMDEIESILKSN
ncbi:MAG: oligoendopeptidase F [Porticoccaceae bacterium]|nr:oligoendopeptidase F [Porticoccaceae bacterium]